ncbi:BBS7 [Symbiodinium necroappetens]|uniref:BBS7 protein n=1 Tax=Symbiodinium necroappetens TaxID=1628268 RepID=A0A812JQ42_9DINO|nr:BBS7 [Symbiodinium necroappetens]
MDLSQNNDIRLILSYQPIHEDVVRRGAEPPYVVRERRRGGIAHCRLNSPAFQPAVESQAAIELISLRADVEVDRGLISARLNLLGRQTVQQTIQHNSMKQSKFGSTGEQRLHGPGEGPTGCGALGKLARTCLIILALGRFFRDPRTYRMQEEGTRFQIRLRTIEGLSGTLSAFVVPATQPKTAHLISVSIKPLALHEKIAEASADIPMNELRLTGPFSVTDMHSWLALCVNELPSRPTDDEMVISYRSTFVGTQLYGRYSKGTAIFRSDSITTIGVLKDIITKEATAKKVQVSMNVDVKEETFSRFLELVHPKLNYQHALTQQVRMVEPLREVQLQEGETKFLHPELQSVLEQAAEIQQQFQLQPQKLAFLHSIVISAYRHKWRLRGYQSVEHRIKDLQRLLESYNLEVVSAFFSESID